MEQGIQISSVKNLILRDMPSRYPADPGQESSHPDSNGFQDRSLAFSVYPFDQVESGFQVNCPVFDFVNIGKGTLSKTGFIRLFGKDYNNLEARQLICPKYNFKSLKTPLFVSTCHLDFLRSESMMLKECLEEGVSYPYKFVDINSLKKKVNHVHNVLRPNMEESVKVNIMMMDFVYEIINK